MRLLGTLTSPFVRRVRAIALELGRELEFVDTTTPAGQAALQRLSPLQKVPVLEVGGVGVLDSHAISALLLAQFGPGPLRPPRPTNEIAEGNVMHAIDGALEAAIRLFYFRRDDIDATVIPYMVKERERVDRTLTWLDGQVRGPWCTHEDGFGLAELAVVTALEWMQFRAAASLDAHHNLLALAAAHAERPSLAATRPPT
jgi:glutathione S-transferase